MITNLALAYEHNTPNKETILQKTQEFVTTVQSLPVCDVSHVNMSSLQCLLHMIQIIIDVDSSMLQIPVFNRFDERCI